MLRFAPSPTRDMDINSLRVALYNYILSKKLNEELMVRIDDTNKEENIEGKDKAILELLSLFSIEYSRAAHQSDNLKYHQKMTMQLLMQKKAFSCFCSQEKLDELKEEADKKGQPFSYDGFCSTLSDDTVLNVNAPFTIRIQKPESAISFTDQLQGIQTYSPEEVDSFVILNHDKTPTYDYACAIDDMLYDMSTIIRSVDYIDNTPKQMHIRSLMGYDKEINYIHLPNIESKEIITVQSLIDDGFLPAAIANYLVLLGNKTPSEVFTLEDVIEWFDVENLSKESVVFDMNKLQEINKKHLESMDEMRLSKILGFADEDLGKLAKLYLGKVTTLKELQNNIDAIFAAKKDLKGFESEVETLKSSIKSAPYFEKFEDFIKHLNEQTKLNIDTSSTSLKYLLTGNEEGPDLTDIYPLIRNYLGEIVK